MPKTTSFPSLLSLNQLTIDMFNFVSALKKKKIIKFTAGLCVDRLSFPQRASWTKAISKTSCKEDITRKERGIFRCPLLH